MTITKSEAIDIAKKECQKLGHPWPDKVITKWGFLNYTVWGGGRKGGNICIKINKKDGSITSSSVSPLQRIRFLPLMKKKSYSELEEMAQKLTKEVLLQYIVPERLQTNLVLTAETRGDDANIIFILYEPGVKREDGIIYIKTKVNMYTGEGDVSVFNLEKKKQ